jgi:hypothetical protein
MIELLDCGTDNLCTLGLGQVRPVSAYADDIQPRELVGSFTRLCRRGKAVRRGVVPACG